MKAKNRIELFNIEVNDLKRNEQLFCDCQIPELDKWSKASYDLKYCNKCEKEVAK